MPFTSWDQPQLPRPTVMAFVDAGYLTAGAQKRLELTSPPRIDGDGLVTWARYALRGGRGAELVRVYVYDAQYPGDAPEYSEQSTYFDQLAAQSSIRLRLGHLVKRAPRSRRAKWEQKGVDTLIVLDLVRMAQLRAFDIALVVSGDRDLAEAVRVIADDHARQVYLFTVEGKPPADRLVHVADAHGIIGDQWVRMAVGLKHPAASPPAPPGEPEAPRQP